VVKRRRDMPRCHVISELNALLARLGLDNQVVVSGIPTAREIGETLERLYRGDVTFSEALDLTRV
jgi:hypothetical protein